MTADAATVIALDAMQRASMPGDAKRPLHRELAPAPAYPVDAMGELRHAAEALHEAVRAPLAMCAQSALAATTLAVEAHRDVELPCGRRPIVGLFATVAESGERKTSLDRLATRAIRRAEERWSEESQATTASFMADKEAYDAAVRHAKANRKAGRAEIRSAIGALGPAPQPPPSPMLLLADPTPEALTLHLADGRPWCGLFTAEGGILIGGAAFTDERRLATGALLNTLWDSEPVRRRRVVTGACFLPGRRCSAHVMVQPDIAARLYGDRELIGIGLMARFLTVAPDTTAGTRLWHDPLPAVDAALADYDGRLASWLERAPRMAGGGALDPEPMRLTPDARRRWIAFHDVCERAMAPGAELATLRPFASKMPEHAGRLAAVLAAYADPGAMDIAGNCLVGGIALAQHYAKELVRIGDAAAVAPDLRLAARLLEWWQGRPDTRLHLAALYQRGLNALGDAATARRIVGILEEHGRVRRLPAGTALEGAARRDAWELVP